MWITSLAASEYSSPCVACLHCKSNGKREAFVCLVIVYELVLKYYGRLKRDHLGSREFV